LCFGRFILEFLEHPTYLGPGRIFGFTMVLKTQGVQQKQQGKSRKWIWDVFEDNFLRADPQKTIF